MNWLAAEWHRIIIALIGLERIWERTEPLWRKIELFERRHNHMNVIKAFESVGPIISDTTAIITDVKDILSTLPGDPKAVDALAKIKDLEARIQALNA